MAFNLILQKEVIEKHNIDKVLIPVNLGNGELENVTLSDLRKALDFCFLDIDNLTLKDEFLNYIEDYSVELRAIKIPNKKANIKRIKSKIKSLKKAHPNLDINDNEDEVVIEEISKLEWKLSQEKYILHYLKELPNFIHYWVANKRQEFENEFVAEITEKRKVTVSKPFPFYCKVGALFAQGFISKKKFECFYNDGTLNKSFKDISKLSRYIQKNILKTESIIRPYINDTLSVEAELKAKDFYKSKGMMKNIIEYCKMKNFTITSEFQRIYDDLIS